MTGAREQAVKWHRFEAKYLISETQALEVRRCCRDYLPPDIHAPQDDEHSYPILSIYLDSTSRTLLRHTIERHAQRFKLRVRMYREFSAPGDGEPAFCEIKRKTGDVVHKTRARLDGNDVNAILWGDTHAPVAAEHQDPSAYERIEEFRSLRRRVRANPVLGVFYRREAYEGISGERTRITMDRNLHYGLLGGSSGNGDMWWSVDPGGVILEVKFTNVYPFWVMDMLQRLEVPRRGVCKYLICARQAGIVDSVA